MEAFRSGWNKEASHFLLLPVCLGGGRLDNGRLCRGEQVQGRTTLAFLCQQPPRPVIRQRPLSRVCHYVSQG